MGELGEWLLRVVRDPAWQFAGVVSVAVAWWIHRLTRMTRRLSYEVLRPAQVLTVKEELEGKIQVLYEGKPVTDVTVVYLRIQNTGTQHLDTAEFTQPISFTAGPHATILGADPVASDPEGLLDKVEHDGCRVVLPPLLLNARDEVIIKLVVQKMGRIQGSARGPGMRGMHRMDLMGSPTLKWAFISTLLAMAAGVLLTLFGVLVAGRSAPLNVLQHAGMWTMATGYVFLIVLLVASGEVRRVLFTKPRWFKSLR